MHVGTRFFRGVKLHRHLNFVFSSFDEYSAEVRSGRLEWSPAHRSEKFWRDNVTRLNEKDFEILKYVSGYITVYNYPRFQDFMHCEARTALDGMNMRK